jgi:uncharacterized protein YciI
MKHYIVYIEYITPQEEIERIRPEHRAFLEEGYKKGLLLFSGPQDSEKGAVIVARARSKEDLVEFFDEDPYLRSRAAVYTFNAFDPVMHQDFLGNWFQGKQ